MSDVLRANGAKIVNRRVTGDVGGIGNKSSELSEQISNDSSFLTGNVKVEASIANEGPIDVGEMTMRN